MRFGIVKNGVVVNVAVADAPLGPDWIAADKPAIGDRLQDGKLVKVVPTDLPEVGATQMAVPDEPALIDGVWTQQWKVIDLQDEEAAEAQLSHELKTHMPSWPQVSNDIENIDSLASAKVFLLRLARFIYLREKRSLD